jgi:hypothetical protein
MPPARVTPHAMLTARRYPACAIDAISAAFIGDLGWEDDEDVDKL